MPEINLFIYTFKASIKFFTKNYLLIMNPLSNFVNVNDYMKGGCKKNCYFYGFLIMCYFECLS